MHALDRDPPTPGRGLGGRRPPASTTDRGGASFHPLIWLWVIFFSSSADAVSREARTPLWRARSGLRMRRPVILWSALNRAMTAGVCVGGGGFGGFGGARRAVASAGFGGGMSAASARRRLYMAYLPRIHSESATRSRAGSATAAKSSPLSRQSDGILTSRSRGRRWWRSRRWRPTLPSRLLSRADRAGPGGLNH